MLLIRHNMELVELAVVEHLTENSLIITREILLGDHYLMSMEKPSGIVDALQLLLL